MNEPFKVLIYALTLAQLQHPPGVVFQGLFCYQLSQEIYFRPPTSYVILLPISGPNVDNQYINISWRVSVDIRYILLKLNGYK